MSINIYRSPFLVKCTIIGNPNVGKTSIIQQFLEKKTKLNESTLGAIFWVLNHTTKDGETIKIDMWDTAGQERYNSLIPMYTRNSDIILITFDITNSDSFDDLDRWIDMIEDQEVDCYKIIVGNKVDMELYRKVFDKDIKNLISKLENTSLTNRIFYFDTSAKTGMNIDHLFKKIFDIAEYIHSKKKEQIPAPIIPYREIEYKSFYEKFCCNIL